MNPQDDDYLWLKKAEEAKKAKKTDEQLVNKVERLVEAKESLDQRRENNLQNHLTTLSYYERELQKNQDKRDRLLDELETSYEKKKVKIMEDFEHYNTHWETQIGIQRKKITTLEANIQKSTERKENKIQKTAGKITTKEAKNEVAEILPEDLVLRQQRKEASAFLESGGHIFEAKRRWPELATVWAEEERKAKQEIENSPIAQRRRAAAEADLELGKLLAKEREEKIAAFNLAVKKAEDDISSAKARGATKEELSELRNVYEAKLAEKNQALYGKKRI